MEDILKINESIVTDDSIESYEFREYKPATGTDLNTAGEIWIVVGRQDIFTHPSKSHLLIEGRVTKEDGKTEFAATDEIAFSNNGLMHLFENIRYSLSGKEIEGMNNPGQGTTILGFLRYTKDDTRFFWQKDNKVNVEDNTGFEKRQEILIKEPNPKGTFSCLIPLKHSFGFMEDYEKVIYGFSQELTLYKGNDSNTALYKKSRN